MVYVWLAVLVVTLIIEFITYDMVTIWFSGGALISLIIAFFWDNVYAQVIIFIVVSALSMIIFRKKVMRYLNRNNFKTNVNALEGKVITLLSPAEGTSYGEARLENGVTWNIATRGERIESGEKVEVLEIDGNKLIVKKFKEE